jgi:hypothetical protein
MTKKVKKAQIGYKSRSVERSPDGNYKMITKEKVGPGIKSKTVKEKRTLKGVIKGAPKSSGALSPKPIQKETSFVDQISKYGSKTSAKSGSKISKKKK